MPLSDKSVMNAVGIFGRLGSVQEESFSKLQAMFYKLPPGSEEFGIFPHLTIAVSYKVQASKLPPYVNLLKQFKTHLPLVIKVKDVRVIDDQNIAFGFDISQTQQIRDIATKSLPKSVINTDYFTVMRRVPIKFRKEIMGILNQTKSLTFEDFKLCANRADESHILHSATEF